MTLELDDKHHYTLDGRRVPGVTEVIRTFVPAWQSAEWYLARGTAVHVAVGLAIRGKLDWSSLDERIAGRLKAIMNFLTTSQFKALVVEHALGSTRYQFAGTPDYIGHGDSSGLILLDWKGSLVPEADLQLGAYALLWRESDGREIAKGAAVECHDDGSYKCQWLDKSALRSATHTFLSMLTIYGWLQKNNKMKMNGNQII